jgi:hypothetical protein
LDRQLIVAKARGAVRPFLFRLPEDEGGTVKRFPFIVAILATMLVIVSAVGAVADEGFKAVSPRNFDPFHTKLVNASWVAGIGCPTNATVRLFNSVAPFQLLGPSPYTDPACTTGDSRDKNNEGLLMAKTGPTLNDASAVADLVGVKGTVLTELGYDIRKPGSDGSTGTRGSHCGAGAPRFDITLQGDSAIYFIGCNSPTATTQTAGDGFIRLRWGDGTTLTAFQNGVTPTNINGRTVKSISIVFDEGYDAALGGPDNFGLAVLDNVDVNATLVGNGGGGNGDQNGGGDTGGDGGGGPNGGGHIGKGA